MRSKHKNIKSHARRRFKERVGETLTQELHNILVKTIKCHKAKLIKYQSYRVRIYDIEIYGETRRIVYDYKRKLIITIFPKNGSIYDTFKDI